MTSWQQADSILTANSVQGSNGRDDEPSTAIAVLNPSRGNINKSSFFDIIVV